MFATCLIQLVKWCFVLTAKGFCLQTCKNIVLAGIGSLVLIDDSPMTFEASAANFLVPFDELEGQGNSIATVCASSLRDFNPMVQVSVEEGVHKMQPGNIRLVKFLCWADLEMKSLLRNTYMQVCSIFCRIYRDTTSDFALWYWVMESSTELHYIAGGISSKPDEFYDRFDAVIMGRSSITLRVSCSYLPYMFHFASVFFCSWQTFCLFLG